MLLLLACSGVDPEEPVVEDPTPVEVWAPRWEDDPGAAIAAGAEVMTRHECRRCHEIDALPDPPREDHCTSCHVWLDGLGPDDEVYGKISEKWGVELITRYQDNIEHLKEVPPLTGLGNRVRGEWVEAYLEAPYDLRPHLSESMIRHNLTDEERAQVADYFAAKAGQRAPSPAPPKPADLNAGAQLFQQKGCVACHDFGNAFTSSPAAPRAPNLRFAKERLDPEVAVAWMDDPQALMPGTVMPDVLTREEAVVLRDWLWHADPQLVQRDAAQPTPRVLDREVSYEEMKEGTLGKVCVHCHMNDFEKDPGPGNLGGLGFEGVGLSMRTYDQLVRGAVDPTGARYSVLEPLPGSNYSPLIETMLLRHEEATRDQVPSGHDLERPDYPSARRGMPMGLPAMTPDEIDLLHTWIVQGCKGPTKAFGVEGVDDGYLVPEGPGPDNTGCHLRAD